MLKTLIIILLCALTVYAPLELSRLMFLCGLGSKLIAELSIFWLFYFLAIAVLTKVVKV